MYVPQLVLLANLCSCVCSVLLHLTSSRVFYKFLTTSRHPSRSYSQELPGIISSPLARAKKKESSGNQVTILHLFPPPSPARHISESPTHHDLKKSPTHPIQFQPLTPRSLPCCHMPSLIPLRNAKLSQGRIFECKLENKSSACVHSTMRGYVISGQNLPYQIITTYSGHFVAWPHRAATVETYSTYIKKPRQPFVLEFRRPRYLMRSLACFQVFFGVLSCQK